MVPTYILKGSTGTRIGRGIPETSRSHSDSLSLCLADADLDCDFVSIKVEFCCESK